MMLLVLIHAKQKKCFWGGGLIFWEVVFFWLVCFECVWRKDSGFLEMSMRKPATGQPPVR